jgi:hypothetical protein
MGTPAATLSSNMTTGIRVPVKQIAPPITSGFAPPPPPQPTQEAIRSSASPDKLRKFTMEKMYPEA